MTVDYSISQAGLFVIEDEGAQIYAGLPRVNFVGDGVTVTTVEDDDDEQTATVTITGGGGGGTPDGVVQGATMAVAGQQLSLTLDRTVGADVTAAVTLPAGGGGGGGIIARVDSVLNDATTEYDVGTDNDNAISVTLTRPCRIGTDLRIFTDGADANNDGQEGRTMSPMIRCVDFMNLAAETGAPHGESARIPSSLAIPAVRMNTGTKGPGVGGVWTINRGGTDTAPIMYLRQIDFLNRLEAFTVEIVESRWSN